MKIIEKIDRTDEAIVTKFNELLQNYDSVTCAISDSMERFNAMTSDMKPLFDSIRFAGTAVTVKTLASDLAAAFKAIDLCQPGDIIVIDSNGSNNTAFWGENMTMSAINKGVVGAIIDGCCRDVSEVRALKFPVFSKGIVPNVASISGYGHVNVDIQCAGVSISAGDLIIADENGVVVVPKSDAEDVLEKTIKLLETEHILQDKIKQGATIGQLVNIDDVFNQVFAYQERAVNKDK